MSVTFSFIGTGNMGGALARAASKKLAGSEILLANRTAVKAESLAAELGCLTGTNKDAAAGGKDYRRRAVKVYSGRQNAP